MLGAVIRLRQHNLLASVQAGMDHQRCQQVAGHLAVIFRHGHDDPHLKRLVFAQADRAPVFRRQRNFVIRHKRSRIGDHERQLRRGE